MWPELKFPPLNLWNAPLSPEMIKLHMEIIMSNKAPRAVIEEKQLKDAKNTTNWGVVC